MKFKNEKFRNEAIKEEYFTLGIELAEIVKEIDDMETTRTVTYTERQRKEHEVSNERDDKAYMSEGWVNQRADIIDIKHKLKRCIRRIDSYEKGK